MKHVLKQICRKNTQYDVSVHFEEEEFHIVIFKAAKALSAKISHEEMEKQATQLKKNTDDYYKLLQVFFCDTPSNVQLIYNVSGNVFTVYLDDKIRYFTCKMKNDSYHKCASRLIRKFYMEKTQAEESLLSLNEKNNRLETYIEELEGQMRELVEEKRNLESEMYNSFVSVLNEKKMRIQHLSELLQAFRSGRPTLNPKVEVKRRTRKKTNTVEAKTEVKKEISSSESEKSYVTDDERLEDKPLSPEIQTLSTNGPDLLSDDSVEEFPLPKRQKAGMSVDVRDLPSTSKHPVKEEPAETEKVTRVEEDSPTVELSTQDLLDGL